MRSRRSLAVALVLSAAMPVTVTVSFSAPAHGARPESSGVTTRASVRSGGGQATGLAPAAVGSPAVSTTGQFVAFVSQASNLVPGDTNGQPDVFVRDRTAGTTTRVSTGTGGSPADGASRSPAISGDGRYVAFASDATNLVAGDTNGETDVFARDLTSSTTRVSVGPDNTQADGPSGNPSISGDGQTVAFDSDATNLVAGDDNDSFDVFVRAGGTTSLVSKSPDTTSGNSDSFQPAVSSDGLVVAYTSDATDLMTQVDGNDAIDVFVRVLAGSTNERGSLSADEEEANDGSYEPAINETGSVVAFSSDATNLVTGDGNQKLDVFVRDRGALTTERVSVDSTGTEANQGSFSPKVSLSGTLVAFSSDATNLVTGDNVNKATDVFLRARDAAPATTTLVSVTGDGSPLDLPSVEPAITGDGLLVAFANGPIDPGSGGTGSGGQILVRDRSSATPTTARVDLAPDGEPGGPPESTYPALSESGRFVAFVSSATDLVPGDTNGASDVFVHDRGANTTTRISVGPDGAQADGSSLSFPFLSADGRYVVFESEATNLVPGDGNNANDVFVHDRDTGLTTRASVGAAGEANAGSFLPFISGNARFVAFGSAASNLVDGDDNGDTDVFVRDLVAGTTERVSVGPPGPAAQANGSSFAPSLSRDGRFVAFSSDARNLVPGDGNLASDAFAHDRDTHTTTRLSVGPGGVEGDSDSSYPIISADGRFATFDSQATNLVSGDTNNEGDVFVATLATGAVERVSVGPNGVQGNRVSSSPWVSGDGRFVAFTSSATNLVPGDTNTKDDAFVRDRLLGTTTRVSVGGFPREAASQSDGHTFFPTMSGDGRFVTFSSDATNLVEADTNLAADVFVHDTTPVRGYRLVATDGGIFAFGADFLGSTGAVKLNQPIVGMAPTPTGKGYWLVASDGGIFAFGDAAFAGSTGAIKLNQPIVGMAPTPTGKGYWLVASDGGIFAFGDAAFSGSTGATALNQAIVGMAATPTGRGYWLVAADGGIFAFGDAAFAGSTGAMKLNQPIVAMAATPSGRGYWLVASDGGVFAFGDAVFLGSTGAVKLNKPIVGMAPR